MSYMTTQKAQTLISDMIDEVIEVTNPEGEFAFEQYMHVGEMNRGEEVNYRIGGFGLPMEREPLEDIDYDEPLFGEKQTIVPIAWGRGFRVAEETIKDLADAGPFDGVNAAKLGQYQDYTKRLKRKHWERMDIECALKLINGTSTNPRYVGRDGVALFSTTQLNLDNPQLSQSNLSTAASMTEANVFQATVSIDTQRDDRGDFISTGKKYNLLFGPSNRSKAFQILKTTGQVDSANNTINTVKYAGDITPVEIKTLDRANGSSYTGWFVQNEAHQMWFKWRQKPEFAKNVDFDAVALKYRSTSRAAHFHKDWRAQVGFPTS